MAGEHELTVLSSESQFYLQHSFVIARICAACIAGALLGVLPEALVG